MGRSLGTVSFADEQTETLSVKELAQNFQIHAPALYTAHPHLADAKRFPHVQPRAGPSGDYKGETNPACLGTALRRLPGLLKPTAPCLHVTLHHKAAHSSREGTSVRFNSMAHYALCGPQLSLESGPSKTEPAPGWTNEQALSLVFLPFAKGLRSRKPEELQGPGPGHSS